MNAALQERAALLGLTDRELIELEVLELADREPWSAHPAASWRAGRDHLRAWLAAGGPAADRGALSIVGDRRIVDAVRAVVDKLPEAIAWHLVGNAMIVCTGIDTKGWVGEWPVPPCATPALVALAVDDFGVIAHEIFHAWHRRPLPAACRLDAAQLERLRASVTELAAEDGKLGELVEDLLDYERMADALARAIGFDIDTTSGHRGERRRAHMLADIDRRESTGDQAMDNQNQNQDTEQPRTDEERTEQPAAPAAADEPTAEGLICDVSVCDADGNFPALAE